MMKGPTVGLVAILLFGLVFFFAMSFFDEGIDVADTQIKTPTFAETMLTPPDSTTQTPAQQPALATQPTTQTQDSTQAQPNTPAATVQTAVGEAALPDYSNVTPQPMDTTSKTILFIGDSMLEGLGPRLAAYAKANGHTLINVIWYSSTSEIWGRTTRLQERINEFHPDYIFVCLGSNELFVRDIKRNRQKYVNNILTQIGNIPYVWIGPPNWKPDTGINDMLQASCAPGSFYLSNGEHFDRAKDGAHPTRASAALWCDRVCKWVMTSSRNPIMLNKPTEAKARCKTIVYQPDV